VQRDHDRKASGQQQRQQPHGAGKAENGGGELHVKDVQAHRLDRTGGGPHPAQIPPGGNPDRARRLGQQVSGEQNRVQARRAESDGQPARIIRHPVQRRLQVAAQQPDPKPGTGKPDLGTSAPARLHHRSIIASH